jgi:hypothetical protein
MLKTNSLILDTLFHNIKLDLDVFGCITRFVVVSIKYCVSLSQYNLSGLSMLLTTLKPGTNFFSHIACPVVSSHATNYAYIVDDVVTVCLELFHDMAPPASKNT